MMVYEQLDGELVIIKCTPEDTINDISAYSHYTANEICDIINRLVFENKKERGDDISQSVECSPRQ